MVKDEFEEIRRLVKVRREADDRLREIGEAIRRESLRIIEIVSRFVSRLDSEPHKQKSGRQIKIEIYCPHCQSFSCRLSNA